MSDVSRLTKEELTAMDRQVLIDTILSQQEKLEDFNSQLNFLNQQIAMMNQRSFGRKTERAEDPNQLTLNDYLNEAEKFADDTPEPEAEEVIVPAHTRKKKTSREEVIKNLPSRVIEHTLSEEELSQLFPNGYKELPCETYKRLTVIPQTLYVDEHRVHVYVSKNNDGTIIKADRPASLFINSLATPSLVAMLLTNKYARHLPLERQSKAFKENGVKLECNTLSNWVINAADMYLNILYEKLHKYLYESPVVHADETPFQVIRDGRPAGSKSYMWVYRTGECSSKRPVILYDYQKTRKTDHPREFLKDFSGVLVSDGYQVYHTLEKERDNLTVAGCWVHAKRKFSDIVKSNGKIRMDGESLAREASNRISKLFHEDKKLNNLPREERLKKRSKKLRPRVDAFFVWVKESINDVPGHSKIHEAFQYCINQEKFLRVFLENPDVPMHNNLAEASIRPFTISRKNWVNIDTPRGAESSAIIYSLVETAKANNLKVYSYFELLLTELSKHADDPNRSFIEDLLPWSETVQEKCRIPDKKA